MHTNLVNSNLKIRPEKHTEPADPNDERSNRMSNALGVISAHHTVTVALKAHKAAT